MANKFAEKLADLIEKNPDCIFATLKRKKMIAEYSISVGELKSFAKRVFKDIDLLPQGFSIDCVTVVFHKTTMQVSNFDEQNNFKLKSDFFLWPQSGVDMIKRLRFHCGQEKIDKQLKSKITIL